MAVAVSYPGVYIQEVPSGVRSIAGVPTSVAAFVGYTARGPVNDPKQIFSFADFERQFGGLHIDSELSYAVNHFFLNGGGTAWIARVAQNAFAASVDIRTTAGIATIRATARSEGLWGNGLIITVDNATTNPASTFNVTVNEMVERNGRLVVARSETFRNLSMSSFSGNYAVDAINAASELIEFENLSAPLGAATAIGGVFTPATVLGDLDNDHRRLAISLDGGPFYEFDIFDEGAAPGSLAALADAIETRVRALEPATVAFQNFACAVAASGNRLECGFATSTERSSITFRNASIRNAAAVLRLGQANGGREAEAAAARRPAPTGASGTRIEDFSTVSLGDPASLTVQLFSGDETVTPAATFDITVNDTAGGVATPTSLAAVRTLIETAFRAQMRAEFARASVTVVDDALLVTAGGTDFSSRFVFVDEGGTNGANELGLAGGFSNVAAFQPGLGPTVAAQVAGTQGADGQPGDALLVQGSRATKTGLFALENVDQFNILNLPNVFDVAVLSTAITYVEERRAMLLIDVPASVDSFEEARDWINDSANGPLRHKNAVVYFPRVRMSDPLRNNRLRSFPNAGLMAGLYARTDAARGVWKAPAGIDARLRGVQALDYVLSDPENGVLNPLAVNCLRTFPVFGSVSWGARTLLGADQLASEWKHVPVRRLALFIEESLYRGTQFAVFEPNDEPLWAQLRLSVGTFMNNLFRQGAFQGQTPQDAYLVRCDSTTTTQADIDLGIVKVLVGFAPLKPAEFVIIQIQQLAGQSQS